MEGNYWAGDKLLTNDLTSFTQKNYFQNTKNITAMTSTYYRVILILSADYFENYHQSGFKITNQRSLVLQTDNLWQDQLILPEETQSCCTKGIDFL